ncbi:hypothetical protein [Actinoplanes sp. NPDC051851]|uniref:hypothetical protein n=1 Tax=Actinoplanes sp. NPDC051851 TaxID=3154753 RepID=UPI00341F230E
MNPQQEPALSAVVTARVGYVNALRKAVDGAKSRPLAETVQKNLTELWEHGGREGTADPRRPERILIRPSFVVRAATDPLGPMLPRLVKSKGLQLRLMLLLLFDAQCRYGPGEAVRNVRRVTPRAGDEFESWRQLVLAESLPARGSGCGPADLRARQITEALRALEAQDLLSIPYEKGTTRRIYGLAKDRRTTWTLRSEASTPDVHPRYEVPVPQSFGFVRLPREFFTNLWIFALTDVELAAYVTLSYLRWRFPDKHAAQGVYLRGDHREVYFRMTRTTWRSTELLHRFRLVDRARDPRRNFRTGNVGDRDRRWKDKEIMPALFTVNEDALQRPALEVIHQVLTAPTDEDEMRRNYGQAFVDEQRRMTLFDPTDFPFATPPSIDTLLGVSPTH